MLKLMHADFYKTFHRVYYFGIILIVAALCIILNISIHTLNPEYNNATFSLSMAFSLMAMPVILVPMVTQIVTDEDRDHTLKNTAAYGTNRVLLYSSKWITEVLLFVLLAAAALAAFFGSMLLLPRDATFTGAMVREFFVRLAAMSTVYAACISMSMFFSALFRSNNLAVFSYYGAFYLSGKLLMLFRLSDGSKYLLQTQSDAFLGNPVADFQTPLVISLVTMAIFFAAGAAVFRRKEVR